MHPLLCQRYVFALAGGAIAYKSKLQDICATSSTEAEFLAAVHAAKTAKYLRWVLLELGYKQDSPTILHVDYFLLFTFLIYDYVCKNLKKVRKK